MSHATPSHVAIIMDGNRRWAKLHGLPAFYGHRRGIHAVTETIKAAITKKIPYVTLFAFSTENWKRSENEVRYLMRLFSRAIDHYASYIKAQQICVKFIGNLTKLPKFLQTRLGALQVISRDFRAITVTIALNYGSCDEITRAVQHLSATTQGPYSWEMIRENLDTHPLPDVDLLIRTSGERRLSNFLLLQSAYAEIFFLTTLWPDFSQEDFEAVLAEYQKRKRNFGQ